MMRRVLPIPVSAALADFGPLRHVELEHTADFCIRAPGKFEQAFCEVLVFIAKRHIFVEQRHDQDRRKVDQQDIENKQSARRPQPP